MTRTPRAQGHLRTISPRLPVAARLAATVLVALACALTWSATAKAATPLTWAGASTSSNWSDSANWTGTAPTAKGSFGVVNFPALSDVCSTGATNQTCYKTTNNLADLTLAGLDFNNHGSYTVSGSGFTLGASGISVTGGGSVNTAQTATITAPITLGVDQQWTLGSGTETSTLAVNAVTGNSALNIVAASDNGTAQLNGNVNVGPFTFSGPGELQLLGSSPQQLNYSSGNAVNFKSIGGAAIDPTGTLELGPLSVDGTLLQLGQPNDYGTQPVVKVNGAVTLTSTASLDLYLVQTGSTPGVDFSSLTATKSIDIAGATLNLFVGSDANGRCHELKQGDTYTLISSPQGVTGTFAGLPNGASIAIPDYCTTADASYTSLVGKINYSSRSVQVTMTSGATGNAPQLATAPRLTGSPIVGTTMKVTNGTWTGDPTAYSYQWYDCDASQCVAIIGATGQSFTVRASDLGYHLMADVGATNANGPNYADSAQSVPVTNPSSVSPSGVLKSIKSELHQAIAVTGKAAKQRAVLSAGGYLTHFTAPIDGYVQITWTVTRKVNGRSRQIVVAQSRYPRFPAGKSRPLTIRLTRAGRALLSAAHGTVTLKATGTFFVATTTDVANAGTVLTVTGTVKLAG